MINPVDAFRMTMLAAPERAPDHHVVDLAPLGASAAHSVVTLKGEIAVDAANVGGPVQTETKRTVLEQPSDHGKRFARLRTQLAFKGYSLVQLQAGSYLVGRWGSSRELADLSAVEQFLQRVSP